MTVTTNPNAALETPLPKPVAMLSASVLRQARHDERTFRAGEQHHTDFVATTVDVKQCAPFFRDQIIASVIDSFTNNLVYLEIIFGNLRAFHLKNAVPRQNDLRDSGIVIGEAPLQITDGRPLVTTGQQSPLERSVGQGMPMAVTSPHFADKAEQPRVRPEKDDGGQRHRESDRSARRWKDGLSLCTRQ